MSSALAHPAFISFFRFLKIPVGTLFLLAAAVLIWRLVSWENNVAAGSKALRVAYRLQRPSEARISGFDYAPVLSQPPGEGRVDLATRNQAERLLLDGASETPGPTAHHALGRYYLATHNLKHAVDQFRIALAQGGTRSEVESDLGVALFESSKEPSNSAMSLQLLGESFEQFEVALRVDPKNMEALYNRGILLSRMKLTTEARSAWDTYLNQESNREWLEDAKQHRQTLVDADTAPQTATESMDEFIASCEMREDEHAWWVLSRNKDMINGRYIPSQLAKLYVGSDSTSKGSERFLNALNCAARLELDRARDPFVSEIASYYARSSHTEQTQLSRAHDALNYGYTLSMRAEFQDARKSFAKAQEVFRRVRDEPEARLCDYWIGYCDSQLDRIRESNSTLEHLASFCEKRRYQWLQGHATTWIANNHTELGEHSESVENYNDSLAIVEATNDTYNKQKILSQLGNQYNLLGQPERALDYQRRSLELSDRRFTSIRQLWRNYLYTARALMSLQLYDAAAAYANGMLTISLNDIKESDVTHFSYLYLAEIRGGQKRFDEALRLASDSLKLAESLSDSDGSQRLRAGSLLTLGHLQRQSGDIHGALATYDRVIEYYDATQASLYKYDVHKGRLLSYATLHDDKRFEAELPLVLEQYEQYRQKIQEEQNRNTFFDKEQSVYDLAILHAAEKSDYISALNYSEKSRARSLLASLNKQAKFKSLSGDSRMDLSALDLATIQSQIPKNIQLVVYSVLNDRIVTWVVTGDSFHHTTNQISPESLRERVSKYLELLVAGPNRAQAIGEFSRELYDLTIAPIAEHLDSRKIICFIPDKALTRLPFGTLISRSSGQYLINEFALLTSPSLNVFLHCTSTARKRLTKESELLLAVGNPAFRREDYPQLRPVVSAEREAEEIVRNYKYSYKYTGRQAVKDSILRRLPEADVFHFAGHYIINEQYPLQSRLVLAKQSETDSNDLLTGDLLSQNLPHTKLVVLSACQTGGERYYNGEGLLGISRVFLEKGIPLVVGTYWNVESDATAELMIKFHQNRRIPGVSTVDALRRAQLELASNPTGHGYEDPFYWAAFVPVGGYTAF